MLLIECPRLLFPFARRIIADITREGGHPPLMIDPIDFVGLYRQQRLQRGRRSQPQRPDFRSSVSTIFSAPSRRSLNRA